MSNLSINLSAAILAGLTAFNSSAAWSAGDRWFRVELLAFANLTSTTPDGAALVEQWDATPALAYPDTARFLIDPARVAQNKKAAQGISVLDEYGRQIISSRNEPVGNMNTATQSPGVGNPTQNEAPRPLTPVYENGAPAPGSMALPRPFVTLSGGYQEFRSRASAMQRSGRYSVLFHETWVQPVPPEDRSLSIVLDDSGDSQQWPRLQGSITIFLARYLQVETNLWLNTAGEYLPGTWQMPAPPFGPPSLIVEEEETVDLAAVFEDMPDATDSASGPGTDSGLSVTAQTEVMGPGATPIDPLGGDTVVTEPAGPVYPFRHAVLLDQKRRMRSGEAHYIDHPLLGLVIKFTPISAQELDAIAESQAKSLDAG